MRELYQHLCEKDRGVIYRMNKEGKSQTEIAKAIGFSQSTVSKELKRNRGKRGYRPKQATTLATKRKKSKRHRSLVVVGLVKEEIDKRLRLKHSPEQISGSLSLESIMVSHETIYVYIAKDKQVGGDLYTNLRINSRRRYKKRVKARRVGKIPNRVGIEERPQIVEGRRRYGDWEADLIEGIKGSGYLLSLYERKSRLGKLVYLPSKGSQCTAAAIIGLLRNYKVKTITYDNGLEFAGHQEVSKTLNSKSYFCAPYHSWEKGGVENYNGLVRQYYPKGSDFRKITQASLEVTEKLLNERPRKTLKYKSPSELENKLAA